MQSLVTLQEPRQVMHATRRPSLASNLEQRLSIPVIFLLLTTLLAGCAATGSAGIDYEYRSQERYVRLEPIESGAAANDHPFQISTQALQSQLSGLQAAGNLTLSGDPIPVFKEAELAEIAGPIASALARARPDQDVTFQSGSPRGLFGRYSLDAFSTGRIFVQNGKLNVIMGVMHTRPDPSLNNFGHENYAAGSRQQRIEKGWNLLPDQGELVQQRGDWIRLAAGSSAPAEVEPAATTQAAPTEASTQADETSDLEARVESRAQELESRLKVLDDLKSKGLITEQEYQEKRQAILDAI